MARVMIRKVILLLHAIPLLVFAQSDLYAPESFYGGGVGFSQMFLFKNVGNIEGFELLGTIGDTAGLGLNTDDFGNYFVVNGGEGFSNITGRWRLGGYAGVGSSSISKKLGLTLFLDENEDGTWQEGNEIRRTYEGQYAPDLHAKISLWIGGATMEYVFPLFPGLEIAAGALLGMGRLNLNISQSSGSPGWGEQFSSIFSVGADSLYPVTDLNNDGSLDDEDIDVFTKSQFPSIAMARRMTSLSGTFFNTQPYVAVKLQFLDKMGLRLSVGFNLASIPKSGWQTDDGKPITNSPATTLNGLAVRTMIYFGL